MQKFLEKSVSHAKDLFPEIYDAREKKGSFHCAVALDRSKIIAVGWNKPEKEDARAFYFARKFALQSKLTFKFLHAEECLIGRLIGMNKLSSSLNIVVLRINRWLELGNSRPCPNCDILLKAYSLNRIWYSTSSGEIIKG